SFADWEAHAALGLAWLALHIRCEEVFGILGENFTFPVKIDKKLVEITWKKNKDKVAEWEEQSKTVYFTSLRNRGLFNKETSSLTIFNLENNDAATYALEMFSLLSDPPSEPTISCNIGGDDLVLKCAAAFKKPLTYISQTEKSLEFSLAECFPGNEDNGSGDMCKSERLV
uniref:Natural killer cell receptor 2B4 immunoglobulin domain-containing protein n=1 Tax=Apteryx owenii TaxID=8824 RepID=A0A8B9Q6D5_APTOW